jgi:non-heme chloroperoxidase
MMKRSLVLMIGAVFCSGALAQAQDLTGDWQGTLNTAGGLRMVLEVSKSDAAGWEAAVYSIDQAPAAVPVSSITLRGADLTFSIDALHAIYQGKLSADGGSISGTFTQGQVFPLDFKRATAETAWSIDSSPHRVQLVSVDKDIKLEALDWGGSGRPLILLAGLGATAHVFDQFALKLTPAFHVYGITRRGFGRSSAPRPGNGNYASDRLGDDVLAVMEALRLERPILVGHSAAGRELSSIGSRYPSKVAALIYLDAGYAYAYYNPSRGDLDVDRSALREELDAYSALDAPRDQMALIKHLLEVSLPQFEKDLRDRQKRLHALPETTAAPTNPPELQIAAAVMAGSRKYSGVTCPVLAFFAVPQNMGAMPGMDAAKRAELAADDLESRTVQANAFETGNPFARVVRLANASHAVFLSNEADVLREMHEFLAKLP